MEIGTALANGTEKLRSASDSPMLDAELLLARAIDVSRSYLIAHPEDTLDPAAVERYFDAIDRRRGGMPIAYIRGEKEFWSMTLTVSPDTLVPRPETETLVSEALKCIPDARNYSILDLGTGSGAIALAIAREHPNCEIVATDLCEAALAVARENANRLALANIEFLPGDWTEPVAGRIFDLVVSNPPYISRHDPDLARLAHEPRVALEAGDDGLEAIRRISAEARSVIRAGGTLMLEHGDTQQEQTAVILAADGWGRIRHVNDLSGKPRVTIAILESTPSCD